MREVKQGTAANVMLKMVSDADHVSDEAGLTLTVTLKKDGAAFASISPTVTDRGSGWYEVALTTSHTDTAGDLVIRATATGADPAERALAVVPYVASDSIDGFKAVARKDATSPSWMGGTFDPATDSLEKATEAGEAAMDTFGTPAGASLAADLAAVKSDTAAILDDTGTSGVVVASGSKTGYGLTSSERTAVADAVRDVSNASPAANSIGADLAAAKSSAASAATVAGQAKTSADSAVVFAGNAAISAGNAATDAAALLAAYVEPLDAAGTRAAMGLAAADLDTQLDAIASAAVGLDAAGMRAALGLASADLDTQLGDILTAAEAGGASTAAYSGTIATASNGGTNGVGIGTLNSPPSYSLADYTLTVGGRSYDVATHTAGQAAFTLREAWKAIPSADDAVTADYFPSRLEGLKSVALPLRNLSAVTAPNAADGLAAITAVAAGDMVKSGTSIVVKHLDGSTARTFTLDDADNPTSRT